MTAAEIATMVIGEQMTAKHIGDGERPSRDEVARLAYHFYEARGRQEGHDVDDWLSAEQQLVHHYR